VGAHYFTLLDVSSAYLQIELHKESRTYTAFLFDSTVYQFKRLPYGFKNSLPAFVRAIKLALGGDHLENVVFYIDDILIHSRTFNDHLRHLDTILGKLTKAGFTINATAEVKSNYWATGFIEQVCRRTLIGCRSYLIIQHQGTVSNCDNFLEHVIFIADLLSAMHIM
jgi:hypothetical protein